jgi:hypothetical protein
MENCGAADCPPANAERRRAAALLEGAWHELVLRRDPDGLRHYLDSEPVHCGVMLELQHIGEASDDYGEYTVNLNAGTVVRYEAALAGGRAPEEVSVTLFASIAGYTVTADYSPRMRFRWPGKAS